MATRITIRQADIIAAIRNLQHLHGYVPSITELSDELQLARGTITGHIARLRAKGVLRRTRGKARSLEIIHAA